MKEALERVVAADERRSWRLAAGRRKTEALVAVDLGKETDGLFKNAAMAITPFFLSLFSTLPSSKKESYEE